ncbi:hypothetical protein HDU87_008074 [Geranomyces variabilis]|uniref:YDG domain-containing protein n=1 Tax=Geranomyces variabilis TaxID=109894 RepID=A0AAD5XTI2_9FUNG|nr:hypothetical protein HDU87_008074 [Geranomyces variabilis]
MLGSTSAYEQKRLEQIAKNRAILIELGCQPLALPEPSALSKTVAKKPKRPIKKAAPPSGAGDGVYDPEADSAAKEDYEEGNARRSRRLRQLPASKCERAADEDDDDDSKRGTKRKSSAASRDRAASKPKPGVRPNSYGPIAGVPVGSRWAKRASCALAGIHRLGVAGIHGGTDGCYSVALSGGYPDDVDEGMAFTYTGEGGRDLKGTKAKPKNLRTAPQSKDQTLSRGNLALKKSVETRNLVRVIRGYKLDSPYAPRQGYRYDGEYTVERAWTETSIFTGFTVWKYALFRCKGQPDLPLRDDEASDILDKSDGEGARVDSDAEYEA